MEQQKKLKLYLETVLPGWWPILDKYMPQFRALDPNCEFFIKEKFGYLRIRALSQTLPAVCLSGIKSASRTRIFVCVRVLRTTRQDPPKALVAENAL